MPDILQDLPIRCAPDRLFRAVSAPAGLDAWWTRSSEGEPRLGAAYALRFDPQHDWRACVTRCAPAAEFELELTRADADWTGTRIRFLLEDRGELCWLRFRHAGWADANEHFRISSHCWALYLRLLRRWLEDGASVPYEQRLEA